MFSESFTQIENDSHSLKIFFKIGNCIDLYGVLSESAILRFTCDVFGVDAGRPTLFGLTALLDRRALEVVGTEATALAAIFFFNWTSSDLLDTERSWTAHPVVVS